jgi:hypothetical protein
MEAIVGFTAIAVFFVTLSGVVVYWLYAAVSRKRRRSYGGR